MRYFFLKMKIDCGLYEFYQVSLHKCRGEFNYNCNYIRRFYPNADKELEDGVYSHNGGEVRWMAHTVTELTKAEYEVMSKHI